MGKLFGNNVYLLAESENSIMGIKLGIIVSALLNSEQLFPAKTPACQANHAHSYEINNYKINLRYNCTVKLVEVEENVSC